LANVLDRFRLDGKTAVITGGAGLLGIQHAEALLDAGAKIALLDVNEDRLKSAATRLGNTDRILTAVCDITREKEIEETAAKIRARFGRMPEILINNAAIDPKFDKSRPDIPASRLENFSLEQWNLELAVGLSGAFLCSKIFGGAMALSGGGVILNIASDLGVIAPDQRLYRKDGLPEEKQNVKPVTYSVIKHGLIGLTKYLATYWPEKGVRCNAFAPSGMFNDHPGEFVKKISELIPMHRMAQPKEYQAAIVFLCSDASSYMNGATVSMDGGRSIW
jgi:NAD(P)-dependent dehydrogenase (short-subunit alcohol dehydrogenase family)